MRLRLEVNGQAVEPVEPRTTLADFLRDRLELTGTHSAASTACAVHVPSSSTARPSVPAFCSRFRRKAPQVITVEGISTTRG